MLAAGRFGADEVIEIIADRKQDAIAVGDVLAGAVELPYHTPEHVR